MEMVLYLAKNITNLFSKDFICGAPARAFIKFIKGHAGFNSCERCVARGSWINHKLVFLESNCERKTDESFVNQLDKAHHKGITLLVNIKNFELITGCALDYMHMACLGVMRKLLNFWINSSIIFTKN
jgi:hypothetical protein